MTLKKHKQEQDIVIEEEGLDVKDKFDKLRKKLKRCEEEKQEYLTGWQRAKADFVNARKEDEKKRAEFVKFSEESLINNFLVLADSFDSLFKHKELWSKLDKSWQKGIEGLYAQFLGILKVRGLEIIETKGKKANYEEHEIIEEVKVDKKDKEGIIIDDVRKGYKLNNKIIRASQVKIGKYHE